MRSVDASKVIIAMSAFLIGMFVALSFWRFSFLGVNLRPEDLLVTLIALLSISMLICGLATIRVSFIFLCLYIVSAIAYGLVSRAVASESYIEFSHYPLTRAFGILLYCITFGVLLKSYIFPLLKGVAFGGAITVFVLMIFAAGISLQEGISGVYQLKHAASHLTDLHVNTFGAIAVLTSFAAYALWRRTGLRYYLVLSIVAMLVPIIYLIRRDIAGIVLGLAYLLLISPSISVKTRAALVGGMVVIGAIVLAWLGETMTEAFAVDFSTGKGMANRDALYATAVEAILSRPLGHGWGSEVSIFEMRHGMSRVAHNAYLSMGIELGIIFPLVFVTFLSWLFIRERDAGVKFFIIVFAIESLFGNGFYFYKVQWIFLLIVLVLQQNRGLIRDSSGLAFTRSESGK